MIYILPPASAPLDQGDLVDGCPLSAIDQFAHQDSSRVSFVHSLSRVVVLTQTCDLANQKVQHVVVAPVHDAQQLVASGLLKPADIRSVPGASMVGTSCLRVPISISAK